MDIAYKDYTRGKVALHFILAVFLPYLAERASLFVPGLRPRIVDKSVFATGRSFRISALVDAFALLYHVRFLAAGGHSSIMERVLGLRAFYQNPPTMGEGDVNKEML